MVLISLQSLAGWRRGAVAAAFLLAGAGSAMAQEQSLPGGFTPDQLQGLERIIHRYLMENPQVLIESLTVYQNEVKVAEKRRRQEALVTERENLAHDPDAPVLGNPDGDVLMVEFFDYRCPYCRRVAGNVRQILAEDGNVRLVMKEFPILGPESIQAARMALAVAKQGKYEAFHFALMSEPGDMSRTHLERVAKRLGLDMERLQEDVEAQDIGEMLRRNYDLAETLGINGTPAFVVGRSLISGAADVETLRRKIAEARAQGS